MWPKHIHHPLSKAKIKGGHLVAFGPKASLAVDVAQVKAVLTLQGTVKYTGKPLTSPSGNLWLFYFHGQHGPRDPLHPGTYDFELRKMDDTPIDNATEVEVLGPTKGPSIDYPDSRSTVPPNFVAYGTADSSLSLAMAVTFYQDPSLPVFGSPAQQPTSTDLTWSWEFTGAATGNSYFLKAQQATATPTINDTISVSN